MNVFMTNQSPIQAANEHNSVHTNKMITEYCQLMSTVIRLRNGTKCKMPVLNKKGEAKLKTWYLLDSDTVIDGVVVATEIFAASHVGNRFVNWVDSSIENYEWLWMCAAQLADNWYKAKGKQHASALKLYALASTPSLPKCAFTVPPIADSVSSQVKALYIKDKIGAHIMAMIEKLNEWTTRAKPMNFVFFTTPTWYSHA